MHADPHDFDERSTRPRRRRRAARASTPPPLFVLLDGMRRAAPRELQGQLTGLIREFLLTLRSLIDWYLERLDNPPREPKVEDIPIE